MYFLILHCFLPPFIPFFHSLLHFLLSFFPSFLFSVLPSPLLFCPPSRFSSSFLSALLLLVSGPSPPTDASLSISLSQSFSFPDSYTSVVYLVFLLPYCSHPCSPVPRYLHRPRSYPSCPLRFLFSLVLLPPPPPPLPLLFVFVLLVICCPVCYVFLFHLLLLSFL